MFLPPCHVDYHKLLMKLPVTKPPTEIFCQKEKLVYYSLFNPPPKKASLQKTVRNIPPGEVGTSSLTQKCLKKHGNLFVPRRVWDHLKSRLSTPGPPETHPGIHRLKAPGFKQPSTAWLGQGKKGANKKKERGLTRGC